tara:strand:- start:835 stop:1005 length:171 start_codon:yes stop_codon:yes gene_type:complete
MGKPLMFMNNNVLLEQLKNRVWENYTKVRACDFQGWYDGLSPIEKVAWNEKFDEKH